MPNDKNPIANPMVVLREELDDWAVLFDPDSGDAYGLDPVGVFIWKLFDGKHTRSDIIAKLEDTCEDDVPDEAGEHLKEFVDDLASKGLVGYADSV